MRKVLFGVIMLISGIIVSCKKDKKDPGTVVPDDGTGPSKIGSALDLMRDSVFLYAKETYYWYDALPAYGTFKPRSFSAGDDLTALRDELNALSQYKINPSTQKAYEYYTPSPGRAKYSNINVYDATSKVNATQGDFGFAPIYEDVNDLRIKYVYIGSPADKAGLKRGYKITSINGNTNFAYDGATGPHTQFVINAYTNSSTITMVVQKPDASTTTVTLNTESYSMNPVLTYKVIPAPNSRNVGYIVFNSFTTPDIATGPLNTAFDYFAANNVTDLVVDFRYNGGGFGSTAEYLCDLIVPSAKTGSLMYNVYFNDIMANNKASILANQVRVNATTKQVYNYAQLDFSAAGNSYKFAKKGSVNISRVFFLVTGNTASASELVINNLRPVMDVKLIGTTTYGKPVGFFDIRINKYEMYIPQFETKNSAGQGGFYAGMTPGSTEYPGVNDYDDATKDFGDPTERLLAYALRYINTGKFTASTPQIQGVSAPVKTFSLQQANEAAIELADNKYNGLFFDKQLKLRSGN